MQYGHKTLYVIVILNVHHDLHPCMLVVIIFYQRICNPNPLPKDLFKGINMVIIH